MPAESFPPAPRRRESLLASLEKKAIPRGMIIFAPSEADPELSCDLISALTDADMEIIENYASRLEYALGGDAEDAYAIAMDAFVKGMIVLNFNHISHQHYSLFNITITTHACQSKSYPYSLLFNFI